MEYLINENRSQVFIIRNYIPSSCASNSFM